MVNEMMGSELHLHTTTDDDTHLIVRVPTIGLTHKQRNDLQAGHDFYITFQGKVMHLFDVETENNLLK
jgi:multiple sugar transport system ATP-binding protein